MDLWETLNSAYEPLYRRAQALCSRLNAAGYGCQWNWYAFHFSRRPEGVRGLPQGGGSLGLQHDTAVALLR